MKPSVLTRQVRPCTGKFSFGTIDDQRLTENEHTSDSVPILYLLLEYPSYFLTSLATNRWKFNKNTAFAGSGPVNSVSNRSGHSVKPARQILSIFFRISLLRNTRGFTKCRVIGSHVTILELSRVVSSLENVPFMFLEWSRSTYRHWMGY